MIASTMHLSEALRTNAVLPPNAGEPLPIETMTTTYPSEAEVSAAIQVRASQVGARLWRNQAGKYQLKDGRWLSSGLFEGAPDLVGLLPDGRFLAIEVKSKTGRPTPAQVHAIEFLRSMGAVAAICRSVEEFDLVLRAAQHPLGCGDARE